METVVVRRSPRWMDCNRVALIDLDGFLGDRSGRALPMTTVADVREKLDSAARDARVRAIVVRVDSPGGGAAASDMMYRQIQQFRSETGRPVVAALMTTAASGGYYVALPADRIVAAPTTVTGSVGAVMTVVNVEGLLGKIGVRSDSIKSGEVKDIGSATRTMTPQERALLEGVIRSYSQRFLDLVRQHRPQMTEEAIRTISDGRILTAEQALELGMVDRIGYLDEAIEEACRLAGIETAEVVLYRPFPHYNENIYARAPSGGAGAPLSAMDLLSCPVGPLYLWAPGL